MGKCAYYGKICIIGGTYCKKNGEEAEKGCSEAAELRRIEKLPCPILEARGFNESMSRCDQTLIARVTLTKSFGSCSRGVDCLVEKVLPGQRAELSQGLPGSKPISSADIGPRIKENIRKQKMSEQFPSAVSAEPT